MNVKWPDITPAQIAAVVGWAVAQAVAYGWLSTEQSQVIMSAGATILAAAWKIADAFLRAKRNQAHAIVLAAQATGRVTPPPTGYTE